jgi:hypothetical protein
VNFTPPGKWVASGAPGAAPPQDVNQQGYGQNTSFPAAGVAQGLPALQPSVAPVSPLGMMPVTGANADATPAPNAQALGQLLSAMPGG